MASRAHCFYCFECLSASFERRDPPTLERLLQLYDEYVKAPTGTPPLAREDEDGDDGDGKEDDRELDSEEDNEETEEDEGQADDSIAASTDPHRPQFPRISRLQASTPSSRSSVSSTPSILSASSSTSQLTGSSSASTISLRS